VKVLNPSAAGFDRANDSRIDPVQRIDGGASLQRAHADLWSALHRMAAITALNRPPITEALVDFRVMLPPSFSADAFREAKPDLANRYPQIDEMRQFETTIELNADKPPATDHRDRGLLGLKFTTPDNRQVAQFRTDGFTLNRLKPYTSWGELEPEALRLWSVYVRIARPNAVRRIALRYINRIDLPLDTDLARWLEVAPPHFPGVEGAVADYVMRVTTQDPAFGTTSSVVQSLQRVPGHSARVLTADIDVYEVGDVATEVDALGPILDRLRNIKNRIFFGMITDNLVARFQ